MSEKNIDVIHGDHVAAGVDAGTGDGGLWLTADVLKRIAGWELKPEGFCRGEVCVPVPAADPGRFVRGDRLNLAAIAELMGQPVVRDDEHSVWSVGEAAGERRRVLTSLAAPDFTLPDLEGRMHSLADYRGKKILLVSWASW